MRSRSERMSLVRLGLLFALAGLLVSLPIGCSDDSKLPGTNVGSGGNGGYGGVLTGPCEAGATRPCGIELEKHGSIVSCYVGTQTCEGGVWGQCSDGTTKTMTVPDGPSSQAQATAPINCTTNPCDPYCWNFDETPDAGLGIDAQVPKYQWPGGNLSGYPGGLVSKGLKQPCNDGYDCQFNMHCVHPKTATSCSHSKCLAGAALNATCRSADRCVDDICTAIPSCCSTNWDSTCVNAVASICDATCGTSYTAPCAHNPCSTGGKLDLTCHPCVAKICALNPSCCSTNWDATCTAAVATICNSSCPLGMTLPPPEDGSCVPWVPGEKDPSCPGVDLAVGVPCTNSIPVCNHGNSAAPAGVRIVHYPANSNQYPKCDPDQTHPQMYECFTTKTINPGECTTDTQYWNGSAWVPGCPNLGGNREIMVNPQVQSGKPTPPGYPGHVAECSCKDNWGLYSGDTCGPPSCASGLTTSTFKKQNLYFMVDRSGSMSSSGLWDPLKGALTTFFQASTSAGLGVALEFFPLDANGPPNAQDGCAGSDCDGTKCANPWVPLGTLTTAVAPTDAQEDKLVNVVTGLGTAYGTPMYPAVEGAVAWAVAQKASKPLEDFSVVLITDGDPYGCTTSIPAIAALASAAYLSDGIKTYVLALPGSTVSNLDQIAIAGGTGGSIPVTAASLAAELIASFQAIAGNQAKCDFPLPNAALYDKNDVTVTFTASNSTQSILPQRNDLAACGTNPGWYFDNNANPTKVVLCPKSCSNAQADVGSSISLNVGCPKVLGPQTHYFQYEGQCPPGAKPVWSFFSYDTVCPGDSSVKFSARTATTQAGLSSASFHYLETAQSTPTDTQVCPMSGPAPCPVDLFNKLNTPDNILPWLELKVEMAPTTDLLQASLVNSWLVTYSCPPSE